MNDDSCQLHSVFLCLLFECQEKLCLISMKRDLILAFKNSLHFPLLLNAYTRFVSIFAANRRNLNCIEYFSVSPSLSLSPSLALSQIDKHVVLSSVSGYSISTTAIRNFSFCVQSKYLWMNIVNILSLYTQQTKWIVAQKATSLKI